MATATTASAAKLRSTPLPPYAGAYQPVGVDERGIWAEADEDERKLRDSQFVIRDPALTAYVQSVLCGTVGADRCRGVRLYVMRVAAFNANMAPNGMMQVWSGMLLRVRSEAELAAILGHEFAHFEERHGLAGFRQRRTATDIASWASVIGGANAAVIRSSAIGAIFTFSRDEERAADVHGFAYLSASRYRSGAFADIWSRTMDEADASALGRRQRSRRYDRVAFFATHPTDLERTTYLRDLATRQGNDGDDGDTAYRAALAPWRGQFLADQLKLNDFEGTEYLIGQLAATGWTADLLLARAELYRTRGNPRDLIAAAQFYRDALTQGSTDPEAYRGLGLALTRSNAISEGHAALSRYLELRPDAADAAMIAALVDQSSN